MIMKRVDAIQPGDVQLHGETLKPMRVFRSVEILKNRDVCVVTWEWLGEFVERFGYIGAEGVWPADSLVSLHEHVIDEVPA